MWCKGEWREVGGKTRAHGAEEKRRGDGEDYLRDCCELGSQEPVGLEGGRVLGELAAWWFREEKCRLRQEMEGSIGQLKKEVSFLIGSPSLVLRLEGMWRGAK